METKTKIAAIAVSGVLAVAAGVGISVLSDDSARVNELNDMVSELNASLVEAQNIEPTIVNNTVTELVEVPVNVTVEKIVEVDNGDLEYTLCGLEDRDVIEDCTEIVAELKAEDSAIEMAVEQIKSDLSDEDFVEDELVSKNILEDEDEFSIVKVYSDIEDVEVLKSNFDDEEYKFNIKVKLDDEEADEKVYAIFKVSVEDGEAEILKVTKE